MQKSNAFSVQSENVYNKIDDFAQIEVENNQLRQQIEMLERTFSQSHSDFFNLSQSKFFVESEFDKYKREAQKELH